MNTQRFEVSERLELSQADHDVAVKGWDQAAIELAVDGSADQCVVEQRAGTLVVEAHAPVALRVPRGTAVSAAQVSGDLLLRDLDGAVDIGTVHGDASARSGHASVSIQEVHGDLAVEQVNGPLSVGLTHGDAHLGHVGAASLARVHGDLNARAVAGDLGLGAVSGDVRVRDVAGALTLEEAMGDFRGQGLAGGMTVHAVKGDLSLKTALTPGRSYSARAGGDVAARFAEGTSARLELQAPGKISVKGFEIEEQEAERIVARAGDGEAEVTLSAGGDLSVKAGDEEQSQPWGFAMDDLGERISAEIDRHLDHLGDDMPDIGALVSREVEQEIARHVDREVRRAQREAEKAARQAERHARRAQERAQRKAQQFQAKFERKWGPPGGMGPGTRATRRGPSHEEQLAVLKMLQENKISPQEAETLLKALGA